MGLGRLLRIFLLAALFCAVPGRGEEKNTALLWENPVGNPSFEEPDPPFAWQGMKNPREKVRPWEAKGHFVSRQDDTVARTGKCSWFLSTDMPEGRNYLQFKELECTPETPFEFRFFTRLNEKQPNSRIWYDVTFYDEDRKICGFLGGTDLDIRADRWIEQVIRFYPPAKSTACAVRLKFCGPMAVWLDDVSFQEVEESSYVPSLGRQLFEDDEFTLWSESSMCQVPASGLSEEMEEGQGIDLAAAANETESFQLVLTPKITLGEFSWEFPALKSGSAALPASVFSCRRVEFVRVGDARDPRQKGLIADPLVACEGNWDLLEKRNTAFFITVKVPAGTPAGVYKGEIVLKRLGREKTRIPVSLKVWGFGLPRRSRLATFFYTSLHAGNYAYSSFDDRPYSEIMDDIHSLKREMRISANHAMPLPEPEWKIADGKVVVTDWGPFDAAVQAMREQYGFSFIRIPPLKMLGDNAGWFRTPGRRTLTRWGRIAGAEPPATPFGSFYGTSEGIALVVSYAKAFLSHVREKFPDLRPFWYFYDDVPYENVLTLGELIRKFKQEVPDLPLLLAGGPDTDLLPPFDVRVAPFDLRSVYSPAANSRERWYCQWRNSINPAETMNARAFAWQVELAGGTGALLWSTIFCGDRRSRAINPWKSPAAVYADMHCTIFYPPFKRQGKCVPSQRAWLIRDGIEDYDLLKIAEERLGKEKVRELIAPWIKAPFDWKNDPLLLEKVRRTLGDAIDASPAAAK